MVKFIQKLEDAVKTNQGGFLGGDTPGAVDYLLWPWIERIGALKLLRPGNALYTSTVYSPYMEFLLPLQFHRIVRIYHMSSILDLRDFNVACYTVSVMYH